MDQTLFFFELTPDRVIRAVEAAGWMCTGVCDTMNSFENRVYDIEVEDPDSGDRSRIVAKFYRPGRWTEAQIKEEHQFLRDLVAAEIPVIAPMNFPGGVEGDTLRKEPHSGIFYSVFPKQGGRSPDELTLENAEQVGRLIARIHGVGAQREAVHRLKIDVETYGRKNLEFLTRNRWIPAEFEARYISVCEKIFRHTEPWFQEQVQIGKVQRLHGDCHLGNLLWGRAGAFFVDFDDMVVGPPVQDLWLLIPGRDAEALQLREVLLEGYESFRHLDRASLRLIEPLRALRFIHYTAWLARRWEDPAFPKAFPHFNSPRYWEEETRDLETQWEWIHR